MAPKGQPRAWLCHYVQKITIGSISQRVAWFYCHCLSGMLGHPGSPSRIQTYRLPPHFSPAIPPSRCHSYLTMKVENLLSFAARLMASPSSLKMFRSLFSACLSMSSLVRGRLSQEVWSGTICISRLAIHLLRVLWKSVICTK